MTTLDSTFNNESQDKTHDNARAPKDISTFVPRHQLKTGRQKRSGNFVASEKKVIPWPLSELHKTDPTITKVQIALEDQVYAEELRRLLVEDGKHRAYVVDRPSPTIDGVVVLDEASHFSDPTVPRSDYCVPVHRFA